MTGVVAYRVMRWRVTVTKLLTLVNLVCDLLRVLFLYGVLVRTSWLVLHRRRVCVVNCVILLQRGRLSIMVYGNGKLVRTTLARILVCLDWNTRIITGTWSRAKVTTLNWRWLFL